MRAAAAGFIVVLAFGCGRSRPGAAASIGAPPDSGSETPADSGAAVADGGDGDVDSGAPADDAGPGDPADAGDDAGPDAGSDAGPDAGPLPVPAQIEDVPCPGAPKVLWT